VLFYVGAAIWFFLALGLGGYFIKNARRLSEEQHFMPPRFMHWVWRLFGIWGIGLSGLALYVMIRTLLSS
jgi:hypothetical protein